jgi:MinD superfamily P-loop ATPase
VLLDLPSKQVTRIGKASFYKHDCIVHAKGTDCAACSEHCPTKAVDTIPLRNGLFLPKVNDDLCIGCGACEYACPAEHKAIVVTPLAVHEVAKKKIEAKAVNPAAKGDFPF